MNAQNKITFEVAPVAVTGAPSAQRGRSRGCGQCRSRRVKCDESKPTCSRCLKRREQCVYQDHFDRLLRDQTSNAAQKAQVMWRSRAKTSLISSTGIAARSVTHPGGVPRGSLAPPIEELTQNRFIYDFFLPLDEAQSGGRAKSDGSYFSFIPCLYSRARVTSSVLLPALAAVASANFARRCNSQQAHMKGITEYGRALFQLKQTLQAPSGRAVSFDALASAYLLSIYELLDPVGGRTAQNSWGVHTDGAAALLRRKYDGGQDHVSEVASLCQATLVSMLIEAMSRGRRPAVPKEYCEWLKSPNQPPKNLFGFLYRTTDISADWHEAIDAHAHDQDDRLLLRSAARTVAHGIDLDDEMAIWTDNALGPDKTELVDNTPANLPVWLRPLFALPGAPGTLHRYESIQFSHKWQFCRAARLVLLDFVMDALNKLIDSDPLASEKREGAAPKLYSNIKEALQTRMLGVINSICQGSFTCFTIPVRGKPEPQSFVDVIGMRGYQLVWPLGRAGSTLQRDYLRPLDVDGRLGWICAVLRCLEVDLGLEKAHDFLEFIDKSYQNLREFDAAKARKSQS